MNAPFAYGEKVLLLDLKQRRYLITLAEGAEFHSHNGFFAHSDLVGQAADRVQERAEVELVAVGERVQARSHRAVRGLQHA